MIDEKDFLKKNESLVRILTDYAPSAEDERYLGYFLGARMALTGLDFQFEETSAIIKAVKAELSKEQAVMN